MSEPYIRCSGCREFAMLLPECNPDWSTIAFTVPAGWRFIVFASNPRRVQALCPTCVNGLAQKEQTTP